MSLRAGGEWGMKDSGRDEAEGGSSQGKVYTREGEYVKRENVKGGGRVIGVRCV